MARRQALEPSFERVDQEGLAEAPRACQELVAMGQRGSGICTDAGRHRGQQVPEEPRLVNVEAPDLADGDKGRLAGKQGRETVHRSPIFRVPSSGPRILAVPPAQACDCTRGMTRGLIPTKYTSGV